VPSPSASAAEKINSSSAGVRLAGEINKNQQKSTKINENQPKINKKSTKNQQKWTKK
jgi:hypothetical protein